MTWFVGSLVLSYAEDNLPMTSTESCGYSMLMKWSVETDSSGSNCQEDSSWTMKMLNFTTEGPNSRGRLNLRYSDVENADLE